MLPQKRFFVKRPRWQIVAPVMLGMVLFTAVILSIFSQSEEKGYLPIVFQDGQPGTPTATSTPCSVYFVDVPRAGEDNVLLSGEVGSIVSIVNLITGETMGTDSLTTTTGYNCPGAADYSPPYQLSGTLISGHGLQAQSDDGSAATIAIFPWPSPAGPTPTHTPTPTETATPIPICGVQFEGLVVETQDYVQVTGEVGTSVTIVDLTDGGQQIGIGTMEGPFNGHACPGFVTISVPEPELVTAHVIAAISSDGTTDTTFVFGTPPTITPSATPTATFTPQPSPTLTPSPTTTPGDPYIVLFPTCGTPNTNPGLVQFSVSFVNWSTDESLSVLWDGILLQLWQAGQHAGTFTQTYTRQVPMQNETYMVTAVSGNGSTDSKPFTVPCEIIHTPTPGSTITQTPAPPDLVVYGPPELISTPPIVAYQPVQFRVPITNTSGVDVNSQFFVDIYLDPNPEVVLSTTIPITESDGYAAVSSLDAYASQIVTITAPLGYGNSPADHHTYAFVDSLAQVVETDETNNITDPLTGISLTPAATPTPVITLTPVPVHNITGLVYTFEDGFQPQFRSQLQLIDEATGQTIAMGTSDITGAYTFLNLPATTTYRVEGCLNMDGIAYFGYRTHLTPPQELTYISLLPGPCAAPAPTPTATPVLPANLAISQPQLISTPPIVAYQPVQFTAVLSNTGEIDMNSQLFVDLFLDPTGVLSNSIPITESDGYSAISHLPANSNRTITITAPLGFGNEPPNHMVYMMADSLGNAPILSTPATILNVTPAASPTPYPTPGGTDEISGGALTLGDDLVLQFRATLRLIDDSTGNVVGMTQSDINGHYAFYDIAQPTTTYTVTGCITIDGEEWYGWLTGIVPPNSTAHVIMLKRPCAFTSAP